MNDDNTKDQGFSESWLALREPADHAARSIELLQQLQAWCAPFDSLNIIELGAGTGSNLRYLMPQLGHDQRWLLMDNDARLLNRLPALLDLWVQKHNAAIELREAHIRIRHQNFSATVSTQEINLATQLDKLNLADTQLLTASALLDLTSVTWLDKLAALSSGCDCACLFALNYNGIIEWQPSLLADRIVTDLLNQHQLGNKGFGPAIGPEAFDYYASHLKKQKKRVVTAQSDWLIEPSMTQLQQAIIDGWAMAAKEQTTDSTDIIDAWFLQRCALIDEADSTLLVGHCDVLALP
jgi:hypothetical protein